MLSKKLDVLTYHELALLQKSYTNLKFQLMAEEECDLYIPCTMCQYRRLCKALTTTINAITDLKRKKILKEEKLYKELNKKY